MTELMRAVIYKEPHKLELQQLPKPAPGPGEALLKILYAGICGSDMLIYNGIHPRTNPGIIMCHEFIGRVESLSSQEKGDLRPGDCVAVEPLIACGRCHPCREGHYNVCESLGLYGIDRHGGLAEYIAVPINKLFPIPAEVDPVEAALIEPLAVGIHVVSRSRVGLGSRVLILGGGPIGYLIATVCRTAGAGFVAVSEVDSFRLAKLAEAGLTAVNPQETDLRRFIEEQTKGRGIDVLFEVAGSPQTILQSTSLVKVRGQVVIVSLVSGPQSFNLIDINFKELDIVGSRTYKAEDYVTALQYLREGRVHVKPLATHIFPLEEAQAAFDLVAAGRDVMKVLIKP